MELNKVLGAILGSLLIITAIGHIGEALVRVHTPQKRSYIVEGVEEITSPETGTGTASAPKGPGPILALLANADVEKGKQVARKCLACHTFDKGGANKVGPNLWGIVNRDAGTVPGFSYSEALLGFEGNWDYEKLNQYLYNPAAYIKGNKMNFVGVKKDQQRADLVAYLRTLSDNPSPLPEVKEEPALPKEEAPQKEETKPITPPTESTDTQKSGDETQPVEKKP